jgi:hypothetical protein
MKWNEVYLQAIKVRKPNKHVAVNTSKKIPIESSRNIKRNIYTLDYKNNKL